MQQSAALKATFTRRSFNPKRASMPSSPSPQESAKKEPFDIDAFLDKLFLPFDSLCRRMSVFYPYFAIQRRKYRIYTDDFKPRTSDKRGNFIPVRYPIIVDRLLQPYQNDAQELDKRADFAKIAAARFHFESLEFLNNLQESFAPFDPDSDAQYEHKYDLEERIRRRDDFSQALKDVLEAGNYVEIPRDQLDRLLDLKIPGALPVIADYDDFIEHRLFIRGVVTNPTQRKPPWRNCGQTLILSSQTLSRVCIFARLKRDNPKLAKHIDKLRKNKKTTRQDNSEQLDEIIIVKLFKDVALEDLKMAAPKVKMKFQPFDFVKIWGSFAAGSGTAVVKFVTAAAFNIVACFVFMFGFLLLAIRNLCKFFNRRAAYLHKYSNQLYYHTLASNFAAVNMLVTNAEEQEVKEFVIGYFMALARGGWSTEREIDDDAEAFLLKEFDLDIDFESEDALRKLREKKLLEERDALDEQGEPTIEYRVQPLDEALRVLDEDWDNFFEYNV